MDNQLLFNELYRVRQERNQIHIDNSINIVNEGLISDIISRKDDLIFSMFKSISESILKTSNKKLIELQRSASRVNKPTINKIVEYEYYQYTKYLFDENVPNVDVLDRYFDYLSNPAASKYDNTNIEKNFKTDLINIPYNIKINTLFSDDKKYINIPNTEKIKGMNFSEYSGFMIKLFRGSSNPKYTTLTQTEADRIYNVVKNIDKEILILSKIDKQLTNLRKRYITNRSHYELNSTANSKRYNKFLDSLALAMIVLSQKYNAVIEMYSTYIAILNLNERGGMVMESYSPYNDHELYAAIYDYKVNVNNESFYRDIAQITLLEGGDGTIEEFIQLNENVINSAYKGLQSLIDRVMSFISKFFTRINFFFKNQQKVLGQYKASILDHDFDTGYEMYDYNLNLYNQLKLPALNYNAMKKDLENDDKLPFIRKYWTGPFAFTGDDHNEFSKFLITKIKGDNPVQLTSEQMNARKTAMYDFCMGTKSTYNGLKEMERNIKSVVDQIKSKLREQDAEIKRKESQDKIRKEDEKRKAKQEETKPATTNQQQNQSTQNQQPSKSPEPQPKTDRSFGESVVHPYRNLIYMFNEDSSTPKAVDDKVSQIASDNMSGTMKVEGNDKLDKSSELDKQINGLENYVSICNMVINAKMSITEEINRSFMYVLTEHAVKNGTPEDAFKFGEPAK